MEDVEDATEILNALYDFPGKEPWIDKAVEKICRYYNDFRRYISSSSSNWSTQDHGECFAAHYFNLICFHFKLYLEYGIDLNSINIYNKMFSLVMSELHQSTYLQKLQLEVNTIMNQANEIQKLPRNSGKMLQKYLIPLEIINIKTLSNCPNPKLRKQGQNILLLRVINALEDKMTKSIKPNSKDFNRAYMLGNTYEMIGHGQVSDQYFHMADKILRNETNSQYGNEMQLKKHNLKQHIYLKLKDQAISMDEIKSHVSSIYQRKNGAIDNIFIEMKYIKYCVKLWMEESSDKLKQLIAMKEFSLIQNLFCQIHVVDHLDEIPSPLNDSKYYRLLKDNHTIISKDMEKDILKKWAQLVIESVTDVCESCSKDLLFVQVLVDLLSSVREPCEIIKKFKLDEFLINKISLKDVLEGIVTQDKSVGYNIATLQEVAKSTLLEEDSIITNNLKKIINSYLIPVKVQETRINGRSVLEVMGRNIAISHHLSSIENALSFNLAIEEVRFVATDVLHIDLNFRKTTWHGKNIVVYTKLVKVNDKVEWDISGNDNTYVYGESAGTDDNNRGENGKDGYSGESGGNVLIIAEDLEGAHNLTIISNGGRGGNGQNGGCGIDGENGIGISRKDLDARFTAPLKLFDLPSNRIAINEKIINEIKSIKTKTIIYAKQLIIDGYFYYYIEGLSVEGYRITTCFHFKGSYLLCKGTIGKPGTKGGIRGLGGQGGFAGDVKCITPDGAKNFCINSRAVSGPEGEAGIDGMDGISGKNGWDMGYVEYDSWKETKYYGEEQQSKLKLHYYEADSSQTTRVWCDFKKKYAEIKASTIEHREKVTLQGKNPIEITRNHGWNAQAVRKRATQRQLIKEHYSHCMAFDIKQDLYNLREQLDKTKEKAFQKLISDKEQEKACKMELNIKRVFNLPKQNIIKKTNNNVECNNLEHVESQNTETIIKMLEQNTGSQSNWMKLSTVHLELVEIERIYDLFLTLKPTTNEEWHNVEQLLHKKYVFARLQEISEQVSEKMLSCKPILHLKSIPLNKMSKYLYQKPQLGFDTHDDELDSLKQYIFHDDMNKRKEVLEYSLKHPENCDALKISVQTFINETINKEEAESDFCSEYQNVLENLDLLEQYKKYVCDNGLETECYRILLSRLYDACIRFYTEDESKKFILQKVYNNNGDNYVHIILRNDKFIELSIDEDFALLEQSRIQAAKRYSQILHQVLTLKQKDEIDSYIRKKLFDQESDSFENFISPLGDEQAIKQIVSTYPENNQNNLINMLEKISRKYVEQNMILQILAEILSVEKRCVSHDGLCFMINCILASIIEDRNESDLYCWIFACYPQSDWFDYFLSMEIENYFMKSMTSEIMSYMQRILNKQILILLYFKIHITNNFSDSELKILLHLLSNIPNITVNLKELKLSEWRYALKENLWSFKITQLIEFPEITLIVLTDYVLSLENRYGYSMTEALLSALAAKKSELKHNMVSNVLSKFHEEKWILSEKVVEALNNKTIIDWQRQMEEMFKITDTERNIISLVKLIKEQDCVSEGIIRNLDDIQSIIQKMKSDRSSRKRKSIFKLIQNFKNDNQFTFCDWKAATDGDILESIDDSIELKRGFRLRDAQKLAVLTLLKNEKSTLAQVSTGEGKSLIVVSVAIIKALKGEKVHIVTSSSVLAKRDADENSDIYSLFDVTVSHNCNEDIDARKAAYSTSSVVYGDLVNFQRDYLLDRFYQKNIYGDHNFKNVIIDEVDSMLLDKGNNVLYLSHDLPDFDKLESVYSFIWLWLNKPASNKEEVKDIFNVETIKSAVLDDIYGFIKMEDIKQISPDLTSSQRNKLQQTLISSGYVDTSGKLLRTTVDSNELVESLDPELCIYADRLMFLMNERIGRDKRIPVPNYLKPFVERHLETWINSAINAYFMKPDHDYVIDIDRSGTSSDRNPNIIIIDRNTGTDQANSQWEEGLHQFLQLKHGCKLSLQSLKAVFISNISYFKLYSNLYGLTGTLGSQIERDLLKEMYNVDYVIIPTAKLKLFKEENPILSTSMNDWIEAVVKETTVKIENKRSVLIICETVNDVEIIHKAFNDKKCNNVYTYMRDFEALGVFKDSNNLTPGQIIIATNLAGRGTDFKLSAKLKKSGGLHVLLTYLPNNIRTEQQAFGRAARCGDMGSGKLILFCASATGLTYSNVKVHEMKSNRNQDEILHVSNIKAHYESKILTEEYCFKMFQKEYESLKNMLVTENIFDTSPSILHDVISFNIFNLTKIAIKKLSGKFEEFRSNVAEILITSYLDKWAFWLDENSNRIANKNQEELELSMKIFLSNLQNLDYDPVPLIKLGKLLISNDLHKEAVKMFNRIINNEPEFCEAAHYYKAFALSKQIVSNQAEDRSLKEMKYDLQQAERLFEERCQYLFTSATCVANFKHESFNNVIRIDAYEEQQKNMVNCYYKLIRSIDNILGHFVSSQSFVNHRIDETLADFLYEDLLTEGILSQPKVANDIEPKKLELLSTSFGISIDIIETFLSDYKGKNINENDFMKDLKLNIHFPSREKFWKVLVGLGVLRNEVKYVFFNKDKMIELKNILPDDLLNQKDGTPIRNDVNCNVFLYNELIHQQAIDHMFKKDEFVRAVGCETYKRWKKLGFFTCNKKAEFDIKVAKSVELSCFNSISITDFKMVGISLSDAEEILHEMKRRNYVVENDKKYYLDSKLKEVNDLKINWCPLYEIPVKRLFSICFAYRDSLGRIITQVESDIYPVRIGLMPKPYRRFSQELMKHRIIEPIKVVTIDLESQLENMYNLPTTKNGINKILRRYKLLSKDKLDDLIDDLIEKRWIIPVLRSQLGPIHPAEAIWNIYNGIFTINNEESGQKCLDKQYMGIERKIKQILNNIFVLSDKDLQKHVTNTLTYSQSALDALNVIDSRLEPLLDYFVETNFPNDNEVLIFFLNGLNELLLLEEKKWTGKMFFDTFSLIAFASAQIALGALIEVYSVGYMTHVASGVLTEGIGDIFYAIGALRTGYFCWKDYRKYKLKSICCTASIAGIAAYFSNGAKFSRFGYDLLGPTIEISGTKATELAGSKLASVLTSRFGQNGVKIVFQAATKRVCRKIIESFALAISFEVVDSFVENYLRGLCEAIGSNILYKIDETVNKFSIGLLLQKAYMELGKDRARKLINDLTNETFSAAFEERISQTSFQILGIIMRGFNEAALKNGETSYIKTLMTIKKAIVVIEQCHCLTEIASSTNYILKNLEAKLRHSLDISHKPSGIDYNQVYYESFKIDTINQWKELLRQKAGRIIEQRIITPILKYGACRLVKYAGKAIEKAYSAYKESNYRELFESLKQNAEQEIKDAARTQNPSDKKNEITQIYHKQLLQLMAKTRSPELFCDIIKENVPMDLTCVNACVCVIHKMLTHIGNNVTHLSIEVITADGIKQTFSSGVSDESSATVQLMLDDNHFQLFTNNEPSSDCDQESANLTNHCLYTALTECFPMLAYISPNDFKTLMCNEIYQNETIQKSIRMGWHHLPLAIGAVGGAAKGKRSRKASNIINYSDEIVPPAQHYMNRFMILFQTCGILQSIAEKTGCERSKLITIGGSLYQDKSSPYPGYQASHLITITSFGIGSHEDYVKMGVDKFSNLLRNIAGGTELVFVEANTIIGRYIDRFQGEVFNILNNIDYSTGSFTPENIANVDKLRDKFLTMVEDAHSKRGINMADCDDLKKMLNSVTPTDILTKGSDGYKFERMEKYLHGRKEGRKKP